MVTTLAAILPVFAVIAAGFVLRRLNILGGNSHAELSRFVVKLALPVLLFRIMADADPATIWQPGFIVALGGSAFVTFALTIAIRRGAVGGAAAVVDGLAAGYSNAAFIGIPLCLALLGPGGLLAASFASIIVVCVLFAIAILSIEIAVTPGANPAILAGKALLAAARNPLVFGPAIGSIFSFGHVELPVAVDRCAELLGAAASPCALVAIGLFLGEKRPGAGLGSQALIVGLKLMFQPLLAYLIAYWLWPQPPFWAKAAVLIAALPTGTGPFMLAELYEQEADLSARVILWSTILSIGTLTLVMTIL
jgi:predicted permease